MEKLIFIYFYLLECRQRKGETALARKSKGSRQKQKTLAQKRKKDYTMEKQKRYRTGEAELCGMMEMVAVVMSVWQYTHKGRPVYWDYEAHKEFWGRFNPLKTRLNAPDGLWDRAEQSTEQLRDDLRDFLKQIQKNGFKMPPYVETSLDVLSANL